MPSRTIYFSDARYERLIGLVKRAKRKDFCAVVLEAIDAGLDVLEKRVSAC